MEGDEGTVAIGLSFALFYALFTLCFVTQSMEFKSAGISPEAVLEAVGWLTPSQDLSFCQHHLRRTSGVLVVHSFLPLTYLVVNYFLQVCCKFAWTTRRPILTAIQNIISSR